MGIISCYVREQKPYTEEELEHMLGFDGQEVKIFIKNLMAYRVLKAVRRENGQNDLSDLSAEDMEVLDGTDGGEEALYAFTYVGIVAAGRRIIKAYPKYIHSNERPVEQMKQVLKVLEKYERSGKQRISLRSGGDEDDRFNLFAVMLFLLQDYHENGLYNNRENIVEINGEGPVLWRKTIDESFALIRGGRPYYMELHTARCADDPMDYFRRLHECVLTECSRQLAGAQLTELFDVVPVELSRERHSDFGDQEYILDRIQAELNICFDSRKQILLKTLYAYISMDRKLLEEEEGIILYGCGAYHTVWEDVCAEVFDNKLSAKLGELSLSVPLAEGYEHKKEMKLSALIDKPVWHMENVEKPAAETLEPDLIAVGEVDGRDYFVILDAKYYVIRAEKDKPLRGIPGVSDVTKQYLYQLAYRTFIEAHNFSAVRNCFVMPADGGEAVKRGYVSLKILRELGLEDIEIWEFPAARMYQHYLAGTHMDIRQIIRAQQPENRDMI